MKTTVLVVTALLAGFAASASPTGETTTEKEGLSLSARHFGKHSTLFSPLDASGRGRGSIWRFGLQVMPMLQLVGEGKNTGLDKTGMLTYKKLSPTIGAGFVLRVEPSPYFQMETGINFARKSYGFEQKSFSTPSVKGEYSLTLAASQFEVPLLFSFGFGSGRTQKTYFRPVIGMTFCRYQYGEPKQKNSVASSDVTLAFEKGKTTFRDLNITTSQSALLGVIGFRVLTEAKKTAFEYGLSYCHDLGEGDRMDVVTRIYNKSDPTDTSIGETHILNLVEKTSFIRLHLVYYFYSQH
jgi:hypothetical protein